MKERNTFEYYGELVQHYLDYFYENFEPSYDPMTRGESMDYILDYHVQQSRAIHASPLVADHYIRLFQASNETLVEGDFIRTWFADRKLMDGYLNQARDRRRISEVEREQLVSLHDQIYRLYIGTDTIDSLVSLASRYQEEFELHSRDRMSIYGEMMPILLSVVLDAAQWWQEHPNAGSGGADANPPRVALTAAAALVEGVTSIESMMLKDGLDGQGSFDQISDELAAKMVKGAVVAATGCMADVAHFLGRKDDRAR